MTTITLKYNPSDLKVKRLINSLEKDGYIRADDYTVELPFPKRITTLIQFNDKK